MIDRAEHIMGRIDTMKEFSNERRLLIDCYNIIEDLADEVKRLQYHNNNLMNTIYQNQSELESVNESTGE